jgi:hypothetical protein
VSIIVGRELCLLLQKISSLIFKPEAESAKIIPFTFKGEVKSLRTRKEIDDCVSRAAERHLLKS